MAQFSKQDYEKVAQCLKEIGYVIDAQSLSKWQHLLTVRHISNMFQADNPRFRPSDFAKAAVGNDWKEV